MYNQHSLDTVCAALAYAMGIEPPAHAAAPNPKLVEYIDQKLGGKKADRIVMYNPDAIGQWIYEKYPKFTREAKWKSDIEVPLCTVMPSVTPVCYATMYTGAQPEVHGIRAYEKPVLTIDTLFDALIRAGKKPVILAQKNTSLSIIYNNRDMDYIICDSIVETNVKAMELLLEDKYDFIVIYNGNYDTRMHHHGPESVNALAELRVNSELFATFSLMIERNWKHHNTLVGFAMDHGCHEIDGNSGAHGLDMEQDMNIVHLYRAYPAQND
ncbi:MAG: alkaline phosphatase family protein [Clostridia bacterium]|nr:alkaline phosphatase family protein [Clostridia bacterium]